MAGAPKANVAWIDAHLEIYARWQHTAAATPPPPSTSTAQATMSAAKARAEARRKAILARGGDRLARITSSARGEEGATYMHDGPSYCIPSLIPLQLTNVHSN